MNIHEHILELHVSSPYEFLVSLSYLDLEQHRTPTLCETKLRTLPPTRVGVLLTPERKPRNHLSHNHPVTTNWPWLSKMSKFLWNCAWKIPRLFLHRDETLPSRVQGEIISIFPDKANKGSIIVCSIYLILSLKGFNVLPFCKSLICTVQFITKFKC